MNNHVFYSCSKYNIIHCKKVRVAFNSLLADINVILQQYDYYSMNHAVKVCSLLCSREL